MESTSQITSTIRIISNLSDIKIDNIRNLFFNNILIQNEKGILNISDGDNYSNALILRDIFLKKINVTQDTDFTLDDNNYKKYSDDDMNYYLTNLASNDIKKYVFLTDVTADYYKTKEDNVNQIDGYNYLHKLKFVCDGQPICNDIMITSNIVDINYNNINNNQTTISETFNYLFNNIIINNNDFNKNVYGIFHYKYKKNEFRFYTALINYNILLAYYYYINDNKSIFRIKFKNKIVNQISTKIIEFKYLFNTYKTLLQKAKHIITATNVKNDLSESEKISNFNEINDKLIEINENIENKRDIDIMFKDNININIKDKIKTITIFIYYTIITFFLLNVILFNYYSVETNKFLSIVVTIFLIFIYFVLKLFKNDYYEYFEGTENTPGTVVTTSTDPTSTDPTSTVPSSTDPSSTFQTTSVSEYRIDETYYLSLMDTSTFENQNLDFADPDANGVITDRKTIQHYFDSFGNCGDDSSVRDDSSVNCIQTIITSMITDYDSLNKDDSGYNESLLATITDSSTKITKLINDITDIEKEIEDTQSLIQNYTNASDGIIIELETSLIIAGDNYNKLNQLNKDLNRFYTALYSKNTEIDTEIEKLKRLINDDIKPKILRYAKDIREKIIDKGNKEEDIDNFKKEINLIETQINALDEINQNIDTAKAAIDTNINILNGNIVSTLDNLLSYRENYNERSKEIADFRIQRDDPNQGTEEQNAANIIISRYEDEKTILEKEKNDIDSRISTLRNQKNNLEEKITNIKNIQKKKTYTYNVRIINVIDIELDDELDDEFYNILENDIAYLLELPQNRIIVENAEKNDNEDYIQFKLKILPSPSYLKLEEHIIKILTLKNILDTLFIDDDSENKRKLLDTIYAKYIVYIHLDSDTDDTKPSYIDSSDVQNILEDELLNYDPSKLDELKTFIKNDKIGLISNNIFVIKNILNQIFDFLNIEYNESSNYKTYYDEVHPNLEKELIKYEKIDNKNNLYDYIIESKLNTTEHDLLYLNALNKFFIHLSIYLGIFYIYVSHFNYFGYTINFLITIIVLLILLYYLFKDINKKVRRDSKKSYWKYSKNYFKNK
jgi:hypothetical protein